MHRNLNKSKVRPLALVLAFSLAAPALARADDDELLSSIYTEDGFELRRDERLFTLFSALNTAGFQRAEQARVLPFARYVNHPIREKLRLALLTSADKLRPALDIFLDTHPVSLDTYLLGGLTLGEGPSFKPGADFPKELAGLDKVLANYARDAKLDKLQRGLASDYRGELKRLKDVVDQPFSRLRAAYRLDEETAPALVLIPNPLDAAAAALARRTADGTHSVVFGLSLPGSPLDLRPAERAYSQLLASESGPATLPAPLGEALEQLKGQALAAPELTPAFVVTESLRTAVEARLWGTDAVAETEAAFKRGLLLSREFLKALDEPADAFPAAKGTFVAQVVARFDARKAAAELLKPTNPKK